MAAKQGLTAQIHQYSEDTKRSLLSRAPAGIKSHSWLSNLNTTCTIKSAPPRTPEVMSMLGSKCGWLVKRNEQHVWQKRWCCVVPHTFLYYFEASPMPQQSSTDGGDGTNNEDGTNSNNNNLYAHHEVWSGGGINMNIFTNLDQDALNMAVKDGYEENGGGAASSGRMSLYTSLPNIMGGGGGGGGGSSPATDNGGGEDNNMVAWDPESHHSAMMSNPISPMAAAANNPIDADANKGTYQFVSSSNLQPVGIIDLECYSAVNRSKINPTVLELAGDSVTNPDLRSFYFQSPSVEDAESWTKALLSDRHQSLKDETDAYRQVCESFPLQLANCSQMIDSAEAKAEAMEREAYSVRSASEEGRRKVVSAVREMLERRCWEPNMEQQQGSAAAVSGGGGRKNNKIGGIKGKFPPFDDTTTALMGGSNNSALEFEESKTSNDEENNNNNALVSVLDTHYEKLETNRAAFLRELEAALSSPSAVATSNVVPPVQTLVDYTSAIVGSFSDLRTQLQKYELDLTTSVRQDQSQLEALRSEIEGRNAQLADAERNHAMMLSDLKSELDASRHQIEELTKQSEAQRMEFGMYQNATKNKLSELQQHKKILKREVIELRKKIDECGSENTTVAHEYEKIKGSYQSMKDKNTTLERYINRLEKQVGVQQNMMEMMSQGGGASFVGKIVGPGVTQGDKDAVSLSGMSMGSQYRRMNGTMSTMGGTTGGGGQQQHHTPNHHGENKSTSHSSLRPRPLLPPESRGSRAAVHDLSPLPTPRFDEGKRNLKSLGAAAATAVADQLNLDDGDDDRDPSTAYYQSTTTTELGDSPNSADGDIGDDVVGPAASASPKRTPNRESSMNEEKMDTTGGGGNNESNQLTSGKNVIVTSPKTGDDHHPVDASRTPIQSNNTFVDDVVNDIFGDDESKNLPSLDTNAERMLDVNASKTLSKSKSMEDETNNNNRKVSVSLNDRLMGSSSPDLDEEEEEDDDLDDNASRVSDITEDRTQRQIDDDLAERRKILLAYVNKTTNGGGGSSSMSLSNASTQRRLETIENMCLPSIESQDASGTSRGSSSQRTGRLSVAQRARLDAENRTNSHRSPSPTPGARNSLRGGDASSSQKGNVVRGGDDASATSFPPVKQQHSSNSSVASRSDTVGRSGSFFKSLGKAIEKAVDSSVLGVSLPADDYDDEESYEAESEILSSVVSEASTTLQDRIAQQRERQVAFLKNKGLIDDESSMRGGAGASSITSGSPNSKAPTPRRALSSRSVGSSRRWSSPRSQVSVAQDEV
ncbi:hypothetical protein ACHAXR_009041 [Thalassiosira sp. AJA248-18]